MQKSSRHKDMLRNLQNKIVELEIKLSLLSDWIVQKFADDLSMPSELKPKPPSNDDPGNHRYYEDDPIGDGTEEFPFSASVKEEPIEEHDTIKVVDIRTITNHLVDDEPSPSTSRTTRQPFVCNVCNRKFRTSSLLKNHEMTHCFVQMTASDAIGIQLPQQDTFLETESQSSDFEDLSNLRSDSEYEHEFSEIDLGSSRKPIRRNRAAKHSCHICQQKFTSKISVKKHLRKFHCDEVKVVKKPQKVPARRMFRCKICKEGNAFRSQILLNKHNADFHNIPIPVKLPTGKCEECNIAFISNGTREQHYRSVHLKIKPFVCSDCGKAFGKSSTLQRHMDLHLDEKKYACKHCEKSFQQTEGLRIHMRRHFKAENSTYQCFQCGQLFLNLQVLKVHIREVHENVRPFGCPKCEKRFKKKVHLNYHLKTHDNPNGRKRGLNKEREPLPKRKPSNHVVLPAVTSNSELDIRTDHEKASESLFLDIEPRDEAAESALLLPVRSPADTLFGIGIGMSIGEESSHTFHDLPGVPTAAAASNPGYESIYPNDY